MVKRHNCDIQISRLRRDLPILVNDRVSLLFHKGLIFTKLRIYAKFRENITLAKIRITVTEFETLFQGLIFWRFLFLPPIAPNKNTHQIQVFYSTRNQIFFKHDLRPEFFY